LLSHLNQFFDKEKLSRSKGISLQLSCSIPLNHKMRLIHERSNGISLEDLHHDLCLEKKVNADFFFLKYWNLFSENETMTGIENFEAISSLIPNDLLLKSIESSSPTWNEFYQIRRNFSNQFGLYSLISHLLFVKNRGPHKIVIGKNSGDILNFDFRSSFDNVGTLTEEQETVPFRFTKNISTFISPFNVEGNLLHTMFIGSLALNNQKERLVNILRMFMMEELCSWQNIKCGRFDFDYTTSMSALRSKVDENVGKITKKLDNLIVSEDDPLEVPVNQKISNLIEEARNPQNLAEMSPTWFPWY
jgi:transformation/transcription domain-associated protein